MHIREDFLSDLEDLAKEIPSVNKIRFRILKLHGQDAFDAVYEPAKHLIAKEEAEAILNKIIASETTRKNQSRAETILWQNYDFEPYILSLFCYQVNEKRLSDGTQKITGEIIRSVQVDDIVENYYNECLEKRSKEYSTDFKSILERELISKEGYRLQKPLKENNSFESVQAKAINDLEDDRIIRKETRGNVTYIELAHDLIARVVARQREARLLEEKIEGEKQHVLLKRRKRVRSIISFLVGFFVTFIFGLSYFYLVSVQKERDTVIKNDSTITRLNDSLKEVITKYDAFLGRIVNSQNIDSSKLTGLPASSPTIVYVQVSNKDAVRQVQRCIDPLKKLNFQVPAVEIKTSKFENAVRYFHKEDQPDAQLVKNICDQLYDQSFALNSLEGSGLASNARSGQIEIWVNYEPYFRELFSSNADVRKEAANFMVRNYRTTDTAKVWPKKMIDMAIENSNNRNGVYNVLVVLNSMDLVYLKSHVPTILGWLQDIDPGIGDNSETQKQLNRLRNKLDNEHQPVSAGSRSTN